MTPAQGNPPCAIALCGRSATCSLERWTCWHAAWRAACGRARGSTAGLTEASERRFFTQAPNTGVLAEDEFVFVDRIGRVHLGGGTTVVCGTEAYRRHLFMLRLYCGLIFSRSSVR